MGPRGVAHPRARRAAEEPLDLCGRRRSRPGQMPAPGCSASSSSAASAPDADLYGVVGSPVAHSLSPAMHNAGFAQAGLNAAYVALEARDADDFVTLRARDEACAAPASPRPFKVAMIDRVGRVRRARPEVGAINTLAMQGRSAGSDATPTSPASSRRSRDGWRCAARAPPSSAPAARRARSPSR